MPLDILADKGKPIVGFDHLAGPAIFQMRVGQNFAQSHHQLVERIFFRRNLPGLVIFAPENHIIKVLMPIDSHVVVWIFGIEKHSYGQSAARNARAEDITTVK